MGYYLMLGCDGLVSDAGQVNDSHPLNTMETGDTHGPYAHSWLEQGFNFNLITNKGI